LTPWSERINLSAEPWYYWGPFTRLVETPGSNSFHTVSMGSWPATLLEISSDFSSVSQRPSLDYYVENLTANTATSELVGISYDGLVYARTPDAVTEWTQRRTLPFSDWDSQWRGITQAPTDGDMFAITESGDLYEIASDFSTATDRPDVPATNVVDLISSPVAGLLIALTEDGRVFTRPDDTSSPWTLRITLPRTLVP